MLKIYKLGNQVIFIDKDLQERVLMSDNVLSYKDGEHILYKQDVNENSESLTTPIYEYILETKSLLLKKLKLGVNIKYNYNLVVHIYNERVFTFHMVPEIDNETNSMNVINEAKMIDYDRENHKEYFYPTNSARQAVRSPVVELTAAVHSVLGIDNKDKLKNKT